MVQDMQEFMPQQENNTGGTDTPLLLTYLCLLLLFSSSSVPPSPLPLVVMSLLTHIYPGSHTYFSWVHVVA
jgi:hypothetical protein